MKTIHSKIQAYFNPPPEVAVKHPAAVFHTSEAQTSTARTAVNMGINPKTLAVSVPAAENNSPLLPQVNPTTNSSTLNEDKKNAPTTVGTPSSLTKK